MNVHVCHTQDLQVCTHSDCYLCLFPASLQRTHLTREFFLLCFKDYFSKWFKFVVLSILLFQ